MNYLAHLYLSGDNDLIKLGNFMGDGVKGDFKSRYEPEIAKGISLHRFIDDFTDHHPLVIEGKKRLYQSYSHYSGVVMDIFYDHFLAAEWEVFCRQPYHSFINDFLIMTAKHYFELPVKIKTLFPFIVINKWFYSYQSVDGIGKVLARMTHRFHLPDSSQQAIEILQDNYSDFRNEFYEFMREIKAVISIDYQIDLPDFL